MRLQPRRQPIRRTRLSMDLRRNAPQLHVGARTRINLLQIQRADFSRSNDVGGEHENDLVILHFMLGGGEIQFRIGNSPKPGVPP